MEERLLELFLRVIKIFLKKKDLVHIALAGGKTPMPFYRMLALQPLPWERLCFYLTDERYVPLNSPQSNYKNIRENLGERAKLFYVNTELSLRDACEDYSQKLPQSLDVCLLGVGEDGHTASLFPNSPCLPITAKVCTSTAPDGIQRISLTYEYLNSSCVVVFVLRGQEKRKVYEKLLKGEDIPASKVKAKRKTFIIYSA